MMNFETLLLNDENYNLADLNTVTEKVFWHWAKKVGIIKTLHEFSHIMHIFPSSKHLATVSGFSVDLIVGNIDLFSLLIKLFI